MSRDGDDVSDLFCRISLDEREACDRMKSMCGIASDANLIRTALWNFSEHLDLHLPRGVFDERHGSGRRKKRYGPTRSLEQLLFRAGINQYTSFTWFKDAQLKPPFLYVNVDAATIKYLAERWGHNFDRQIPGLEIRPMLKTERPVATTKYPAIKPGRHRDLLDDEDV